jgi:arylsulfatase
MPLSRISGHRRTFLKSAAGAALSVSSRAQTHSPNIVLVLCDDLGYGDLSCYGSSINTPNLDQMAHDGVRFTNYYSASPVCSPARASVLTGRYPPRTGVTRVLGQDEDAGLPDSETTIAQMLKGAGYSTMCIGKWHLGAHPQYLPTNRGFDEWYGIPYSHDMWPRPLMHNLDVIEQPANLDNLTQRYTQWAVDYISRSGDAPFFLYMPHSCPHIPLAASQAFLGKSNQGLYGDVVQEIDWSVGQVLQAIQAKGLDSNTLVMFSSDHGPWYQGSPGRLRGRKNDTYEGGMRVPFIARYPGFIPSGQTSHTVAAALDLLPTIAQLTGAALPNTILDGIDLSPILAGQSTDLNRDAFLYFNGNFLQCARLGPWKLHATRFNTPSYSPAPNCGIANLPLPHPELYHVMSDPQESYDRADRNPAIVNDILSRMNRLVQTFPDNVVSVWNAAMATQVQDTPAGALPSQPNSN